MIVKICGIKTVETLKCCENNNVNFFGMIFYNESPRNITDQLVANLPPKLQAKIEEAA